MLRKIILSVMLLASSLVNFSFALPPSFSQQFEKPLLTDKTGSGENLIAPSTFGIDADKSFKENMYNLFSPLNNNSFIRRTIRTIMVAIVVLYIAWSGIEMMQKATDEKGQAKARRSLLYIIVGCFLIWGVTRILGTALQINTVQGSQGLLSNLQNNVLFQILSFLKAFAFFYAIVIVMYCGFQFMRALEEEKKIAAARTGIVNVIIALILIKIIDFIFFIAQQKDFGTQLQEFVINAARVAAYVLGAAMVLALIYGWFRYLTASGDESKVKDAKKIITTIFFIILIIFMFLLIAYQIIAEFA